MNLKAGDWENVMNILKLKKYKAMFDLEKPKWIIQDNQLRLGRVVSHSDLENTEGGKVVGGGWWHFDAQTKTLYLYGESIGYGPASIKNFENIWVQPSLEKATILFSTENSLERAKLNNTIVQDFDEENLNAN